MDVVIYLDPNEQGLAYSCWVSDSECLSGCAGPDRTAIKDYGDHYDTTHHEDINAACAAIRAVDRGCYILVQDRNVVAQVDDARIMLVLKALDAL